MHHFLFVNVRRLLLFVLQPSAIAVVTKVGVFMNGFGSDGHVLLIVFSFFFSSNKGAIVGCLCVARVRRWHNHNTFQEYRNKRAPFAESLGDVVTSNLSLIKRGYSVELNGIFCRKVGRTKLPGTLGTYWYSEYLVPGVPGTGSVERGAWR